MTIAWYGHLKLSKLPTFSSLSLIWIILLSWGVAFFEYCFQIPANRYGFVENGGAFNMAAKSLARSYHTSCIYSIYTASF